jgi:hypothetical protein
MATARGRPSCTSPARSTSTRCAATTRTPGSTATASPSSTTWRRAMARPTCVICRAGALTVAELAAAGVAAMLVPFPHAVDDHQTATRSSSRTSGAALLCRNRSSRAESLAALIAAWIARHAAADGAVARGAREARRAHVAAGLPELSGAPHDDPVRPLHDGTAAMKHKVKHIHFVGIGGAGHERHRRGADQPRLPGQRFGSRRERDDARLSRWARD